MEEIRTRVRSCPVHVDIGEILLLRTGTKTEHERPQHTSEARYARSKSLVGVLGPNTSKTETKRHASCQEDLISKSYGSHTTTMEPTFDKANVPPSKDPQSFTPNSCSQESHDHAENTLQL